MKANNGCNCVLTHQNAIDLIVLSERGLKTYIMRPFNRFAQVWARRHNEQSISGSTRIRSFHAQVNAFHTGRAYVAVCFSNPVGTFWPSAGLQSVFPLQKSSIGIVVVWLVGVSLLGIAQLCNNNQCRVAAFPTVRTKLWLSVARIA